MRELLSRWLVDQAKSDPKFLVLSGDHGYALFNAIRQGAPDQFVNVGICEQGMIGYAAGLASLGFKPVVYGLAAFVPMRVVEQVKLDLCHPGHPVIILGDGAGLVYSTLGTSHQCGEDLACLRPMPGMLLLSPCDSHELALALAAARAHPGPSYIRIGKSDRPAAHASLEEASLQPHWVQAAPSARACLVGTGSMVSVCRALAREQGLAALSVPQLKPVDESLGRMLAGYEQVITVEEHNLHGGLYSVVCEELVKFRPERFPQVTPLALQEHFAAKVGDWQYALSEHQLADAQIKERVLAALKP